MYGELAKRLKKEAEEGGWRRRLKKEAEERGIIFLSTCLVTVICYGKTRDEMLVFHLSANWLFWIRGDVKHSIQGTIVYAITMLTMGRRKCPCGYTSLWNSFEKFPAQSSVTGSFWQEKFIIKILLVKKTEKIWLVRVYCKRQPPFSARGLERFKWRESAASNHFQNLM